MSNGLKLISLANDPRNPQLYGPGRNKPLRNAQSKIQMYQLYRHADFREMHDDCDCILQFWGQTEERMNRMERKIDNERFCHFCINAMTAQLRPFSQWKDVNKSIMNNAHNKNKYRHCPLVFDIVSEVAEMRAVRVSGAKSVILILTINVTKRRTQPQVIVSDNGMQYESDIYQDLFQKMGIRPNFLVSCKGKRPH